MDRPLLILDLDETLVFATTEPIQTAHDLRILEYFVHKRPFLDEFLSRVFDWFDVAVWTSSGSLYAAELVPSIFPEPARLCFVWDSRRCTLRRNPVTGDFFNLKDLKKVKRRGYNLARILMIDDTPEKLSRQHGNHLAIAPFEGDPGDRELARLLPYLEWLSAQENFRKIDKSGWKKSPEREDR